MNFKDFTFHAALADIRGNLKLVSKNKDWSSGIRAASS